MFENLNLRFFLIYIITTVGMVRFLLQIRPLVWTKHRDNLFWLGSAGVGLMAISVFDTQFFEIIPKRIQLIVLLIGGACFGVAYFMIKKKFYTRPEDDSLDEPGERVAP